MYCYFICIAAAAGLCLLNYDDVSLGISYYKWKHPRVLWFSHVKLWVREQWHPQFLQFVTPLQLSVRTKVLPTLVNLLHQDHLQTSLSKAIVGGRGSVLTPFKFW